MTKFEVNYYINKFEAIPEDKWCEGVFNNKDQYCALGHCGANQTKRRNDESDALCDLFNFKLNTFVGRVNDGRDPRFQQDTPKQRILAALRSIGE